MKYSDEDKKKIDTAKKKYDTAKANNDTAGMESAHAEAEAVRANYGISGGGDGSQEIPLGVGSGGKSGKGTSADYGSYQNDLSQLAKAQQRVQVEQLKQARDKALANLDVQKQNIKPTYQNARNQASATSQSGARSFAEYLANRGLTNSGAAAQGEINRLSAYQNTLGGIDTAEANAYRDIENQRNAIQNDYVAGVANANNAIAQQYYNNLLNYNEQQRQMVNQLQQQSLGQYANDYQAYKNSLLAQGYSPNSLEVLMVDAARGNKVTNAYSNVYTPTNSLNRIYSGNWNANDLLMTGLTQEQATEINRKYMIDQELKAIQEKEALEREITQQEIANQQKWAQINNDTLQTQYNINKPYYKTVNGGQGAYTLKEVISMLNNEVEESESKTFIDNLYNNGLIDDATFDILVTMY